MGRNNCRTRVHHSFISVDCLRRKGLQIGSIPSLSRLAVSSLMTVEMGPLGVVYVMTVQLLSQYADCFHVVVIESLCSASPHSPTCFESLCKKE